MPSGAAAGFDKLAILKNHAMFGQLQPEVIKRLASYSHVKAVRAGATIFQRGDPGDSLFAVFTGTVKISNRAQDGKDAVFNIISPGQIFGEIALLDGQPRTADAAAVTDCHLMVVDRRDFIPLLSDHPDTALKIIELLCSRLRHTSEQVEDTMFLDLPGRLAKTLLWLSRGSSSAKSRKVSITQREMGQMIGMSRESTNKQLRDWEERNWVRLERGGVVLLDPGPLEEIVRRAVEDRE